MLAREEDVEAQALRAQGWSISAIARHLGRDPKTVRSYLNGERTPGVRRRSGEDPFERFEPYAAQRLKDDPHLQLATLLREVRALGFSGSYQTLTRQVRVRSLRPHCEACSAAKGRPTTEIEHPPGAETQLDWLELPEAPWGGTAIVLVGALAHSAKFRGFFSEAKGTAHLIAAMDGVLRRLGGLTKRVRIDAIEGGVIPGTRRLVPTFADACRHYGVGVDICPARRGNRKGVVEKANDYLAQAWWRTAEVTTPEQAQASLDRFCDRVADLRPRGHATVGILAAAERLRPVPRMPYHAEVQTSRKVSWGALVSFEGNRYSVPPAFVDATVIVSYRLGEPHLQIRSMKGGVIASHRRRPAGSGALARLEEHRADLERTVLAAFTTDRPCRRKVNRPPSQAAKALAAELTGVAVQQTLPVVV
ncbi:MAG TPA: helix-turn-helix domain-containing protein, partial [Actinomycetota bacterium]|nr:helix-turn-helix domain-containing protein [Actinomycetota bacterium]